MGEKSRLRDLKIKILKLLAKLMPRDLVYFVLMRVEYAVTADKWPDDDWPGEVPNPEVSLSGAISRWHMLGNLRDGRKKIN